MALAGKSLTAIVVVAVAGAALASSAVSVNAQERVQRSRSILEFFGIRRAPPPEQAPVIKKRAKKRVAAKVENQTRKKPRTPVRSAARRGLVLTPPAETAAEPQAPVLKLENAKTILVIGDFMASAVAEGLTEAFQDNANVKVVEKANGSSGLVRDDYFNWPGNLAAIMSETKPAVVVVMLGINDRQQMLVGKDRESVGVPVWNAEYERRVADMANALKAGGVSAVWVGQPALRSSQMTASMLAFNDLYRKNTERIGGTFVDIWDGFVDENGVFQQSGPDMNGLPARLRGGDGISFSKAGKRKAAFFVEKPLRQILGVTQASLVAALPRPSASDFIGPMPPAPVVVTRTEPVGLNDPDLDGGVELMGAAMTDAKLKKGDAQSAASTADPLAAPPKPGRVNDFSWKSNLDSAEAGEDVSAPATTGATR